MTQVSATAAGRKKKGKEASAPGVSLSDDEIVAQKKLIAARMSYAAFVNRLGLLFWLAALATLFGDSSAAASDGKA